MDATFARPWLRLEGLAAFALALALHWHWGLSWGWFAALFLVPDLSMLGYFAGPRVGAVASNLAHSYVVAALPLLAALAPGAGGAAADPRLLGAGLVWCAHIGFDRALGYGLKSSAGFTTTHLGPIGRRS